MRDNSPVPGQTRKFGVRCGGARPSPGGRHSRVARRGAARTRGRGRGRGRRRVARDGTRGASERVRGRRRDAP